MNIEIDGISVNYRMQGEGEWLLLLHGWGADIRCFDRIFQDFSSSFKVIAPDLPGFGLSDDPDGSWGVGDYAGFVLKFMDALGISRCVLLGHSFGGRISIKLSTSAESCERVSRIILTGSAGLRRKTTFAGRVRAGVLRLLRGAFCISGLGIVFPGLKERLSRRYASRDYLAANPLMRKCLIKVVKEDLAPLLPQIEVPVLLIWGADDTETPLADGYRMDSLIPDSRLEVLPEAGHFAFLNHPDKFSGLMKGFLS